MVWVALVVVNLCFGGCWFVGLFIYVFGLIVLFLFVCFYMCLLLMYVCVD